VNLTTYFQLVPRKEDVDLDIHYSIDLHGVVLKLSTGQIDIRREYITYILKGSDDGV
jgi:hypothetical protein